MTLALLAPLALLTACGSGGGNTGGAGGTGTQGGAGGAGGGSSSSSSTSTSSGTMTTPGCIELCTELNKCPGPTTDCENECPKADMLTQAGGCGDAYVAMVQCILASADPCKAYDDDCINESAAFVTCTSDYCKAHPETPACP